MLADSGRIQEADAKQFNKKWEDIDNDKERFYFCIQHLHELDDLPEGFAEEGIWARLARQSEFAAMESDVKIKYIKAMTTEIDRSAQMIYAKRIAREEGLAEGVEQTRLTTARNLKSEGIPADVIAKCTGLTLEQVAGL